MLLVKGVFLLYVDSGVHTYVLSALSIVTRAIAHVQDVRPNYLFSAESLQATYSWHVSIHIRFSY